MTKPSLRGEGKREVVQKSCYLFLDIDGVMIPFGEKRIAPRCAESLRMVVSKVPGLGIVISSSWRAPPLERLLNVWRKAKLPDAWIVGHTPDLAGEQGHSPELLRGQEIRLWLSQHAKSGTSFAIVDDQTEEILPLFSRSAVVRTEPEVGLTAEGAARLVRALLKPVK